MQQAEPIFFWLDIAGWQSCRATLAKPDSRLTYKLDLLRLYSQNAEHKTGCYKISSKTMLIGISLTFYSLW